MHSNQSLGSDTVDWNNILVVIRFAASVDIFKKQLKTNLFKLVFVFASCCLVIVILCVFEGLLLLML